MQRIAEPDDTQLAFASLFPSLVLASSSPNRKALLEEGGCSVRVFVPDADESRIGSSPLEIVSSIAGRKIDAYLASSAFDPTLPAIAADTLVHIDGRLLGKPQTRDEAASMLSTLSGRTQTVISSAGLYIPKMGRMVISDEADVIFRPLSEEDIEAYADTGEWMGAAGGYRLQKTGFSLVERIDGDWTTVVGLPLLAIMRASCRR